MRELVPPARTVVRYALPTVAFAGTLAAPLFPMADVSAFVLAIVFARVVAAIVTPSESQLRHRVLAALTSGFPLLVVTGGAIVTTGSRSLEELVASSASAPLGCAAFRSPIHLALAATALFLGVAPAVASATRTFEDPNWVRRGRFASAWEWLGAWVQAALVAVLFFGGWRAGGAAIAVSGAAFALKTALLFVIAVALRNALSPALPVAAAKSALLRGAPAALALVVLARVWEEHVAARVVQMGATVASIAIVLALAVALGRRPGAVRRVGLDPFR